MFDKYAKEKDVPHAGRRRASPDFLGGGNAPCLIKAQRRMKNCSASENLSSEPMCYKSNMESIAVNCAADAGYNAWLAFKPANSYCSSSGFTVCAPKIIYAMGGGQLMDTAVFELKAALKQLSGIPVRILKGKVANGSANSGPNALRTAASGVATLALLTDTPADDCPVSVYEFQMLTTEGYIIKGSGGASAPNVLIAAKSEVGVLYGVFAFLRMLRCGDFSKDTNILENPATGLRMLNHWDNMDGSVERGYAGKSIFFKDNNFIRNTKRIHDYARLMASIGLNAVVLNNVNVHAVETKLITSAFLPKVARVADIFRKYGIKTFLSINYCSPMELGGLNTADPLDAQVAKWWAEKAKEIYDYIPDFGGFLVKADSEFRPGPFTYGRSHAEGANVLAEALRPYGGLVIWRCFVYNCTQDWRDVKTDRANAAYDNFMPLDGLFADNVLLQIKNGPMDFQVREPVSPLLGGLKKTNIVLELQITQEYTGQQKHLCYLAPMWKDVLDFDTYRDGAGSTVAEIIRSAGKHGLKSGMAAVANIGDDLNWTGHDLAQANLYCYGRLAWNPELSSEDIAREWVVQTFGCNPAVVDTVTTMLLESYGIYESYTSPLGIGWMVNPGHHYGPSVDGYEYSAWGTYHRADLKGIGVDRTAAAGTGFAGRYNKPVSDMFEDPDTCPEELLLFFHRVPYTRRLKSGKTLIQHIYDSHFDGAEKAAELVKKWNSLRGLIPSGTFERVLKRLHHQAEHAKEWRDVINSYFWRKSGIPDEKGRTVY